MNRFGLGVVGIALLLAQQGYAREAMIAQEQGQQSAQDAVPGVEQQLPVLTKRLGLSEEQQAKIRPILQELHDATVKIVEDKSLTQEERMERVRPLRYTTRDAINAVLDAEQQKKFEEYLKEPHPEMHGKLNGSSQN